MKWLAKLLGWGALSVIPGGSWLALAWQGVRAVLKAVATVIGWFWEAIEIVAVKPVVLTIVIGGVGLGVFLGISWDAHLVQAARAERNSAVAAARREVDDVKHQMKALEDRLQETDDADERRADAAGKARKIAEERALAEKRSADAGSGAVGLRDAGQPAAGPAASRQVRRRCEEPWMQSVFGYCF